MKELKEILVVIVVCILVYLALKVGGGSAPIDAYLWPLPRQPR